MSLLKLERLQERRCSMLTCTFPHRLTRSTPDQRNMKTKLLTRSLPSGSGGHSAHMTSYSDSGYQDSGASHYSNQNVVRTEPRSSLSRSPRAEGQTSGQVSLMKGLCL